MEGEFYHKSCFRCAHGGCFLTPSTYAALDGYLYCKPHFSQLFKEKGSYSYLSKQASLKRTEMLQEQEAAAAENPKSEADRSESEAEPETETEAAEVEAEAVTETETETEKETKEGEEGDEEPNTEKEQ